MKKAILLAAMVMASNFAMADGFVCENEEGLVVKVYNQTQPELGTRSAATMIISDSNISYGSKTIAKFTAANSTLASHELTYVADVDLRFNNSNRKGELIGGTKLGELDMIALSLDHSYATSSVNGEEVEGTLSLIKRNGDVITHEMACTRYLKN